MSADERYRAFWVGMRSQVSVPICDGAELFGVLTLESAELSGFDEHDVVTLIALADLAVSAMRNARYVSQLKAEQEARVNAEQMVLASSMAATFAHRMGNDAGVIRGWAQEIERRLPRARQGVATDPRQLLANIIEAVDHLNEWAARLAKTRHPEQAKEIEVNPLLADAIDQAHAPEHVRVITEYSLHRLSTWAPPAQLVEAFRIVLENAIDAMPQAGTLTVSSGISEDEKGKWVEVLISDTGQGMSEEDQQHIGELFFTTKPGEGMGYGVWWTRTFLRRCKGDLILVRSKRDQGTTFAIRLPHSERGANV